jgi:hypothetical protein
LNKTANILLSGLLGLVEWEILVLDGLLNRKGGPPVDLKVEVAGVGSKGFCVNSSKIDDPLVVLCKRPEDIGELFAFFRGFGEDAGKRNTSLKTMGLKV